MKDKYHLGLIWQVNNDRIFSSKQRALDYIYSKMTSNGETIKNGTVVTDKKTGNFQVFKSGDFDNGQPAFAKVSKRIINEDYDGAVEKKFEELELSAEKQ